MTIEPTNFINVDLDLVSRADLTPLHDHIEKRVFVLYHGAGAGRSRRLSIEIGSPKDVRTAFRNYVRLFDSLPRHLRALWRGCQSRTLDIGIDASDEPHSTHLEIPAAEVAAAARLGAVIVITVYSPHRPTRRIRRR